MRGRLRNSWPGWLPLWSALIIATFVLLFGSAALLARSGSSVVLAQATATSSATASATSTATPTPTATAALAAAATSATTPTPVATATAAASVTSITAAATTATVTATALATTEAPTFGSGSSATVGVNVATSASSPSVTVPLGSILPNSTLITVTAPATLSGPITFNVTPSAAELAGVNGNLASLEVIDVASNRQIACAVAGDHLVCTAPGPGQFVVIATALSVPAGRGPAPISAPQQTAGNSGAGALAATPPAPTAPPPAPIAQPQQTAGATGAGALAASPTPAVLQLPAPLAQPQQVAGSSGAGAVAPARAAPVQPVTTTAAAPPTAVGLPPTGSGGLLARGSAPDWWLPWVLLAALGLISVSVLPLRRRR